MTVQINGVQIPNVLVDLGATINVITTETMHTLGLCNLKHTPTVLELADRSTIKPSREVRRCKNFSGFTALSHRFPCLTYEIFGWRPSPNFRLAMAGYCRFIHWGSFRAHGHFKWAQN